MNEKDFSEDTTFGVIGICGIVGNLIARILKDRSFKVIGTDITSEDNCKFKNSLKSYDIPVYYGSHPKEFFNNVDYIIPPPSLSKSAKVFNIIKEHNIPILELDDILTIFLPNKPVFGITGTNGKTTTISILKKIAYDNSILPSEHDLLNMQGNVEFIPSLQSRLNGDVAILEVGTFGEKGSIEKVAKYSNFSSGLITNITPDHLNKADNFLKYANVKGEFIKALNNKQLIVNSNDPTIMGLIRELDFKGDLITFGVDETPINNNEKTCVCGRKINIKEIISGSGYYLCECGLTTPQSDYIATNIKNNSFTLFTPNDKIQVKMQLKGIHNVYNVTGAIIAAHEFLKLPFNKILKSIASFSGVDGRMEKIATINGKDIIVDFAHNPAGVITVLQEFKKLYGDITTVITISSESGYYGDLEIFNNVLNYSKIIVPASKSSQKIANLKIKENSKLKNKILVNNINKDFVKEGTLGSTYEDVLEGIKTALKTDSKAVIVIGETATKFKSCINDL